MTKLEKPLYKIDYLCPECATSWVETWDAACDSECPACGLENIEALDWDEIKHPTS